jgi:hypothetical protein
MGTIALLSYQTVNWMFDSCCISGSTTPDEALTLEYNREITKMLMELPDSTFEGDSWKAFMFTALQEQWASEETAKKLIDLGLACGLIEKVADIPGAHSAPIGELPYFRVLL